VAHLLGYARVSSAVQDETLQVTALQQAGCQRIYTDRVSGALDRRPELDRLLERLDAGDTLVVWRLDRLGRNLRNLIEVITVLGERGVQFRSLQEALDTTTAGGRLLFHIMGSIAEFERQLIRDRTLAGLASARARGRKGGRRPVMTADKVRAARQMYDSRDYTVQAIADALHVSRATIYNHLGGPNRTPAAPMGRSGRT
jgi:DNA invertase Pin-like site-specific DNA recombinase